MPVTLTPFVDVKVFPDTTSSAVASPNKLADVKIQKLLSSLRNQFLLGTILVSTYAGVVIPVIEEVDLGRYSIDAA